MPDVESLQEENAVVRRQLTERDARLVELAESEARLKAALLEIERIELQLAVLRRQRYGQSLARAVCFRRLGLLRDHAVEMQQHRASGLTLVTAAIALWNTMYLGRALDAQLAAARW